MKVNLTREIKRQCLQYALVRVDVFWVVRVCAQDPALVVVQEIVLEHSRQIYQDNLIPIGNANN